MQILPDGTVQIRNKRTGQTKIVQPNELPNYGISYSQYQQEADAYQASIMGKDTSAVAKKKAQTSTATENFINDLEKMYTLAGGGEYEGAGARVSGVKKTIAADLGLNDPAKTYKDAKEGFAATLKQLTGDTGVLTDQDYERLSKLLPSLSSTPGEAKAKFEQLRGQISATFGGEQSQSTYQEPKSKGGLVASVLPGVASLYEKKKGQSVARNSIETMLPILNLFTPEGRSAGAEVLSVLGLGSLGKAGLSKLQGITKSGALANRAKVAAGETSKISGDSIYKKAEESIMKSISETDRKPALKFLENAKSALTGKTFDAQTALEKLAQYNKAYTTSGMAGKSAKAAVNDALSKALRSELPEAVFNAQQKLKTAMGVSKTAGSVGRQVLGTGIGVGAAGLIGWLLGRNKK